MGDGGDPFSADSQNKASCGISYPIRRKAGLSYRHIEAKQALFVRFDWCVFGTNVFTTTTLSLFLHQGFIFFPCFANHLSIIPPT